MKPNVCWQDFFSPILQIENDRCILAFEARTVSMQDFSEITRPSSSNTNNIVENQNVVLFVLYSVLKALV